MYWTVSAEGGPARVYHASVAIGRFIYTFGGRYCSNKLADCKMEVHVLDTLSLQSALVHVTGDSLPPNLLGHTAVAHERKIYIWGGYHSLPFNHEGPSDLWCFDPATRSWSQPETFGDVPSPRIHHTACVVNDCMFIIGGFERRFGFPMRVVNALNLLTMTWRVFPTSDSSPQGGVYRSAILTKASDGYLPREGFSQICLFGGATARTLFPTGHDQRGLELFVTRAMGQLYGWKVAYLDATTGEWIAGTSPYLPTLTGSSGFVYGYHLYMTMNGVCAHGGRLSRRSIGDIALEEVLPLGAPRTTRCLGSCVVVDDRVFFIGGATPPSHEEDANNSNELIQKPGQNNTYNALIDHYGAVQVLDFRPNLRAMCVAVIVQHNLNATDLPQMLQKEIEMCTPRFPLTAPQQNNSGKVNELQCEIISEQ